VLDPTFGTGGVVTSLAASGGTAYAVATYPQAGTANDGKIVVAGWDYTPHDFAEVAIVRYNLDGSPDTSFNKTGAAFGPSGPSRYGRDSHADSVAILPNGRILAAGGITTKNESENFGLFQYNADGSVDQTFGTGGVVSTDLTGNSFDEIGALGLQADGKIVVAGVTRAANSTTFQLAVARYNADGSLDASFGAGGLALNNNLVTTFSDAGAKMGLAIDPATGYIVVLAQDANSNAMVVRYTSSGALDPAFAGAGHETLTNLYPDAAVAIQASDHRIVLPGRDTASFNESLERLNWDGTPDGSFGSGGLVVTPFHQTGPFAGAMKVLANGQIVVGATGESGTPGHPPWEEFMVTRFASNGTLDTSFGVNGAAIMPSASLPYGSSCYDIALEPDGRIVVAGIQTLSGPTTGFEVARFLATVPQITSFTASPNPLTAGSSLTLTASSIIDRNSTVTQVTFYYIDNYGTKQQFAGSQTSPGVWTFTSSNTFGFTAGSHTLYAQAQDSSGLLGDPLALTLQVT
jgi:uncharacterized delta-60 repeat protein